MTGFRLKLFIMGHSSKSLKAIVNLRRMCHCHLGDQVEVQIVDVLNEPELAEQEQIVVTPTLVKVAPEPACRIIGDLSETERVLQVLGVQINAQPNAHQPNARSE